MGAHEISRHDFLKILKKAVKGKTHLGKWTLPENLELLT